MRKVSNAYLHQNLFIPGIGDMGSEIPNPRKAVSKDMHLTYGQTSEGEGMTVVAVLQNGNDKGKKIELFVPSSNVKQVIYAAEEKKAEIKSA